MEQMDLQQKVIQDEWDTPFLTDLMKDDTSLPKKHAKHDVVFDSSEPKSHFYYREKHAKQDAEGGDEWMIQNEGDTPFLTDLMKDDRKRKRKVVWPSLPNKRAKHDADFDSSQRKPDLDYYLPKQKPDLDYYLPKQKHERGSAWFKLFQYRFYKFERREVFKDMTTKCEEEIQALKVAYEKATNFFDEEIAVLEKEKPCRMTTYVLKTIRDEQKRACDCIRKAGEMLPFVEADVETYIKYRDDLLLTRNLLGEPYFESVKQLAEMPGVDKMIKFWSSGVADFEPRKIHRLLSGLDLSALCTILREKARINSDVKGYNEDKEQFDPRKMIEVFNAYEGPMRNIHSLREAHQAVVAEVKKQSMVYQSVTYGHMSRLLQGLRGAVAALGIMRQHMKLLRDKNVIEKGYNERFQQDWCRCRYIRED